MQVLLQLILLVATVIWNDTKIYIESISSLMTDVAVHSFQLLLVAVSSS